MRRAMMVQPAAGGPYPFTFDFEAGVTGWVLDVSSGAPTLVPEATTVHAGAGAGKHTAFDASIYNGFHLLLPTTLDRSQTIKARIAVRRESALGTVGLRLCNAALAGYSVVGGMGTSIFYNVPFSDRTATGSFNSNNIFRALSTWYIFEIEVAPTTHTARIYDTSGALLAETLPLTNSDYTSFDRVFINNSTSPQITYWDDLLVTVG